MHGPIFRLFVSSTFIDMRLERDLLQRQVFPKMKRLAFSHGADLRVVDLRWGIPEAAARLHTVPDMCLQEVEQVLRTQIEPRLLCLVGDRYGWRPLPPWLLEQHMLAAQDLAARGDPVLDRSALDLLREWYVFDENSVPPHYALIKSETESWRDIEPKLRAVVDRLGSDDAWLWQHAQSLTEREARLALDRGAKAFALVRTIADLNAASTEDRKRLCEEDPSLQARLKGFRDYVVAAVPDDRRISLDLSAAVAMKAATDQEYNSCFTVAVEAWMTAEIHAAIAKHRSLERGRTETERQRKAAEAASQSFLVRHTELVGLVEMINNPKGVVIVRGAQGSGKTTLVARAWVEADDGNRNIIARFLQSTDGASPRLIMDSILHELQELAADRAEQPAIESAAIALFQSILSDLSQKQQLTLLFDAADEIPGFAEILARWVTGLTAKRCGIVISVRDGPSADTLLSYLPTANTLTLRPLERDDGGRMLDHWLANAGRRLQPSQRDAVLASFEQSASPLWLRVAFEMVRKWKSTTSLSTLPNSVEQILHDGLLLSALDPTEHVPVFSLRAISLIAAARSGLTENELIDCISADETFWVEFNANPFWDIPDERVPDAVWGRLKVHLAPFLTDASSGPAGLLRFRHTTFVEVMREVWRGRMPSPHALLRGYFTAQELFLETETNKRTPNQRKLIELPFHLAACDQTEELVGLVSRDETWRAAWVTHEGSDRSFQADVDLALDRLNSSPDGQQLKFAAQLMRARWTADPLRADAAEDDLRLLVWADQESRAIHIAASQDDPELAAVGLAAVVDAISARSSTIDPKLLERAEKAASGLPNPWPALRVFELLGSTFARLGDEGAFDRVLNRLSEISPKYGGDGETKARFVARVGEEAAKQGHFDLAQRTIGQLRWGLLFDGRVEVRGAIAQELAARGRLDEAVEIATALPADQSHPDQFDYGMVWAELLRGARRSGPDALREVAMRFDPEQTSLELVYECAFEVAEDPTALRHVLRLCLDAARSVIPELAQVAALVDAAPKRTIDFSRRFQPPPPPTPEQKRAQALLRQAENQQLQLLCHHAIRLNEPFSADLLRLAYRLHGDGNADQEAMSIAVRAAAFAECSRAEESAKALVLSVKCALGAAKNFGHSDEVRRLRALRRALKYSLVSKEQLRELLSTLGGSEDQFRVAIGVILSRNYLPVATVELAVSEIERQLDTANSIVLLRLCSGVICGMATPKLVHALLARIETCLGKKNGLESGRDFGIHDVQRQGMALLDPAKALSGAIAGEYGGAELAVKEVARCLSARTDQPTDRKVLNAAALWLCSHGEDWFGFTPIMRALMRDGQFDLASRYAERLLGIDRATHRVVAGLIIEFAQAGQINRLSEVFNTTGVAFSQDLHWLLWAADQSPDKWPSTSLSTEHLEALEQAAGRGELTETALAARELGMPASDQIVDLLLRGIEQESTNHFGLDMRNYALKELCINLCDGGALSQAARVMSRIRKSGGDGANHVDWSTVMGAFGAACCRQGEIERARGLLADLDVFDADERSAVDQIRRAIAEALLKQGALSPAESEIVATPSLKSRRYAQGLLATHHCANGRLQEGLRLIHHDTAIERIRCFMECVNGVIATGGPISADEYRDILKVWRDQPTS